jgi:hypothetical protein
MDGITVASRGQRKITKAKEEFGISATIARREMATDKEKYEKGTTEDQHQ